MFADQIAARDAGRRLPLAVPIRLLRLIARLNRPRPQAFYPREIENLRLERDVRNAEAALLYRRGAI